MVRASRSKATKPSQSGTFMAAVGWSLTPSNSLPNWFPPPALGGFSVKPGRPKLGRAFSRGTGRTGTELRGQRSISHVG
jgi:hypothetical protein